VSFDKRILTVSLARGIDMFSISILVVVLPLYVAGDQIIIDYLTKKSILGFPISREFLIGVAFSISILVSAILTPYFGRISDKLQKRKIFISLGLILLIVSMPLYFYAQSYYTVLGLRLIQGISGALVAPASLAMVNEYAKDNNNHGESFGYYNTIRLIGFGIGPVVAGFVISQGPYTVFSKQISSIDATFYIMMAFIIIAFVLLQFFVDEPKFKSDTSNKKQNSIRNIIHKKEFKFVLIFALATFWLSASINMFATLEHEINTRFDQSSTWFGLQFSAALLANIITQTPIGKASDKYDKKPFIILGFIILIPVITLQGFAMNSQQMIILRLLQGMSAALVFIPSLTYVGEISDSETSGFFLSLMSASFSLGAAIGPLASGILFTLGGFELPFITAGFFSLFGLIVIIMLTPKIENNISMN
jgi:MFS family permease